jgi:hypothetical protein
MHATHLIALLFPFKKSFKSIINGTTAGIFLRIIAENLARVGIENSKGVYQQALINNNIDLLRISLSLARSP